MKRLAAYILLMRPKQWIKNLFVFLPVFFSLQIGNITLLRHSLIAFIAFSLVASSIYIFNDIHDIEEDQKHPVKRNRPISSGKINLRSAYLFMTALLATGILVGTTLNADVVRFLSYYLLLNFLYTLWLKKIAIIDTFIISIGFVLRLYIGSFATGIHLSVWIILMTFLLALFLALSKRKDDLNIFEATGKKTRKTQGYTIEFLNLSMTIMASIIIVSYIMYSTSPTIMQKNNGDMLYITTIFVLLGIMRYMQLSLAEKTSTSPTDILYTDRVIQLSILGWIGTLFILLY
ncbi:MAG: decaprenyl-phosphate phosphoribosyltransferase [Candidatus Moranbacteria bacterium]|nr:decaprenyl-phosphate phosphoribosyltransferase [Candidatus Moranbacteria bacterium]